MDFRFTENYKKYRDILNMRAVDCLCKHVCNLDGEKARKVYELGQKVGYKQVIWGVRRRIFRVIRDESCSSS